MKISELIEYVKELRPGTPYSDTVFLRWINDLEAELCTEVYLLSVEDFAEHTATDESVTVDATHTKIFWSYLLAMISLANGEMSRYNDDFAIFKGFMTEYKSWYAMTYHPADKKAITSGYYLTAYALAVKYGFEGTEEEWVNAVEYSRVAAETAAQSAKSAQEEAEKAKTAAEDAKAEVVTNTKEAQSAASTATQKASDAVASAKAAADSAANSARKATESADSAQAAAESATSASESAIDASTAKAAAEAAQQAAETAKTAAQEAQSLAESAKVASETAAINAGTSEDKAKAAHSAAENAKSLAETAQNAAEGAHSAAEAAKNAAAQSAQNAQESANNAENSADESEAWACGTIGGIAVHSTHPAYQNNAKWYKEQAREIVGGDYATKTEAQGYVDTHNSDSTAHSELFSEKLDKTGDGSNVSASFTAADTRENIGTGEKLAVIFGKIKKWFADLGSLAFKSTVAKADLESDVQTSLNKANTAVQSETDPTVPSWAKAESKPSYSYSEIEDAPTSFPPSAHKSTHAKGGSDVISPFDIGAIPTTEKGQPNGIASLDAEGKVPNIQLPQMGTDDTNISLSATVATALGLEPATKPQVSDGLNKLSNAALRNVTYTPLSNIPVGQTFLYDEKGDSNLVSFIKIQNNYAGKTGALVIRENVIPNVKFNQTSDTGKYSGSTIDIECNNIYYNSLQNDLKTKIKQVPIVAGYDGTLQRYCFILSKKEISSGTGGSEGTFIPYFNSNASRISNDRYWLRTTYSSYGTYCAYCVDENGGTSNAKAVSNVMNSRPVFLVDQSLQVNPKLGLVDMFGDEFAVGVQMETGSYIGTGVSGESNPTKLTFSFIPKLVIIQMLNDLNIFGGVFVPMISRAIFYHADPNEIKGHNRIITSFIGTTLSWYAKESGAPLNTYQLNYKDRKYHYIALG